MKFNKLINKHLLITTIGLSSTAIIPNAIADCTNDGNNNYTCTDTTGDTAFSNTFVENTTITVPQSVTLNGTNYGINVEQSSGSLTVDVDGTVNGTNNNAIRISSNSNADVTLTIGDDARISSGAIGVDIANTAGNTKITTSGTINGGANNTNYGISVIHSGLGQDITVDQTGGSITGSYGINTANNGKGSTTITASGNITGTLYNGIYAYNSTSANSITVTQEKNSVIEGETSGINVANYGTGNTTITTSGTVTGNKALGIYAINNGKAGDLTISQLDGAITGKSNAGIYAENNAQGKTTITTSGTITGEQAGVNVLIGATASDLTIKQTAGSITGTNGIIATNNGSGFTDITVNGDVTSTTKSGLSILNNLTATSLSITQSASGKITGATNGISTTNNGTGTTSVTTQGTITGNSGAGVYIANGVNNTESLAFKQTNGSITGSTNGISIHTQGTGSTSITSNSTIIGNGGAGISTSIDAINTSNLMINQTGGSITGSVSGISTNNEGSGNTEITTNGTIDGKSDSGISVQSNGALSITQNLGKITGYKFGIYANNVGTNTSIFDIFGSIIGQTESGIYVTNTTNTTDLKITSTNNSSILGATNGIYAENNGTGQTTITAAGTIVGTNNDGINIKNSSTAGSLTIASTNSILGGVNGINAENNGKNGTSITANTVTGKNGVGIYAKNTNAALLIDTLGNITGGTYGIYANNSGTTTDINISSVVTGGTEAGVYTTGTDGQPVNITLNSGADVSATTSNVAIKDDNGNANVTLNSGAKVSGQILLGAGSDTLTINSGADVTKATVFDGGTAANVTGTVDTDKDILNIYQSLTGSSDATISGSAGNILMTNWEEINIGNTTRTTGNNTILTLSSDLTANAVNIETNGVIQLASNINAATITGDVTNAGTINLSSNSIAGDTLTIIGNYTGNKGNLLFDGVLGDDNSLTDKLVITGDATGTTYVTVNNLGGTGAQTIEGIQIVSVGGESADNAFVRSKRIVAGSYEYSLVKGNASGTDAESWFLTSKYVEDKTNGGNGGSGDSNTSVLRPEAGAYIANLTTANTLFNLRLHDRLGETQYTDLLTGEKSVTSMWIRSVVGQNRFTAGHDQLKNRANWSLVQLGGDIAQWSSNGTNRLHLGVMAGYGRSSSDADARLSGYSAKGSIDGYSLGFYGTWYDNDADKTGLYVDSWVLWNHFNAKVHGQELDREKYKLKGITASIESGYTFKLGGSELYNYWLQPKAQITYMGVDADNHTESNGTKVKGDANNWQSRLGVHLSANTNDLFNSKHTSAGQLFIEANWLHNTEPFSVKMDNSRISQDGARNIAEIKTGVEANILTNTNVWFNLAYQRGDHSYRNIGAMLGAKYSF